MKSKNNDTITSSLKTGLAVLPLFWLIYFALSFLFALPFNWTVPSSVFVVLMISLVLAAVFASAERLTNRSDLFRSLSTYFQLLAFVPGLCFFFIMPLSGFLPGQAERLGAQLGKIGVVKTSIVPELGPNNAPLVPYRVAFSSATRALSQSPVLDSRFRVGDLHKQRVGGALEWIGFLEPKGLSTWFTSDGTPGYVRVSATDASEVKVVTSLGGKPLNLRYTDGSFFGSGVDRKLFFHDLSARYEDTSAELDDSGRPFYVATRIENDIGFYNHKVVGITVLDPQTGEATDYDLKHIPAWVDRVYPEEEVLDQIRNWGKYLHGAPNPYGRVAFIPSSSDVVYSNDGNAYFVVGLSPDDSDSNTYGFLFVNTRTKEVTRLDTPGISEKMAVNAANFLFSSQNYQAGNAIPFLVNGEPTYVVPMIVKDHVASYAIVSLFYSNRIAAGKTPMEAYRAFSELTNAKSISLESEAHATAVSGPVERIARDSKSGSFALKLRSNPVIFLVSPGLSRQIFLTQAGDVVELEVSEGEFGQVVRAFKNKNL